MQDAQRAQYLNHAALIKSQYHVHHIYYEGFSNTFSVLQKILHSSVSSFRGCINDQFGKFITNAFENKISGTFINSRENIHFLVQLCL